MRFPKKLQQLTPEGFSLVAGRFRLLSEPLRLQILNRLQAGETSVSQLALDIGTSQPNVSKHLRLLIEGGLVARRQERTSVFVRVADPSVFELCQTVCGGIEKHLHARARAFGRTTPPS
ncbi:MAG: winged helix-turn-helix transcriptional regulator [Vicinamibacteria bacterium]|nr:winged helix-turn-helix transcriptional regulator [Vicinamibacteria bacterium]